MDVNLFQFWSLFLTSVLIGIQLVGMAILFWKAAVYVGGINETVKQLTINQSHYSSILEKHIDSDIEVLKCITKELMEIKLTIAKLN